MMVSGQPPCRVICWQIPMYTLVDIRALLPVDLDADKIPVEESGNRLILEAFVRHHVAPVARGYPMERKTGLFSFAARENASSPTGTSQPGCAHAGAGRGSSHG